MPYVHIELLSGRTYEQKEQLVQDVTEAVVKNTGAPAEAVHVIITEIEPHHLGQAGKLKG